MGIIYKISGPNNVPGESKDYIGQTTQRLNERWNNHKSKFKSYKETGVGISLYTMLSDYDIENFTIHLLETCDDAVLNERETHWINELNTVKPYGYNMHSGGISGGVAHQETRDKMAVARKQGGSIGLPTYINDYVGENTHGYHIRYRPSGSRKTIAVPLNQVIPDNLLYITIAHLTVMEYNHAKKIARDNSSEPEEELEQVAEFIYDDDELQPLPQYITRITTKVGGIVTRHGFKVIHYLSKKTKITTCPISIPRHHDMYLQAVQWLSELEANWAQKLLDDQQILDDLQNLTI